MTSRNKNIILVIAFLLALLIAYNYAISNTLNQRSAYKDLKKKDLLFKNAPKQLSILKQKELYYDSLLVAYKLSGHSFQNNLLKTINHFAKINNLKVIDFIEPHSIKKEDLILKTYQFTLEGNYNAIISLIHKLEQETKFGEIINIDFQKKKNFRTGRYYLQAKVLLRSLG